jgi:hypothetical protein
MKEKGNSQKGRDFPCLFAVKSIDFIGEVGYNNCNGVAQHQYSFKSSQ